MKIERIISLLAFIIVLVFNGHAGAQAVVDNFDRAALGANWTADPEYQIVSGELANTSTTPAWSYLAVYNAVANPFEVSFKWAASADVEGANSGGVAIYLNSASTNASGYFILRRYASIDLHPIINGLVDRGTVIATVAATQPAPGPGDVIKVVASTDGTGHHFQVYLNNALDGTLSDPNKLFGNVSPLYAGVSLYGNRNNNIDDFTLRAPVLTLTSPNGGEIWIVNSTHNITWNSSDFTGNVKIELSVDGGANWTTVAASVANTGSYSWTIPNSPSTTCLIRISDAADGEPSDVSDANFRIDPETEQIELTSPNGGENWIVNTNQEITWTATSIIQFVRIEYSVDNGATWTLITASTPNNGSYTWTVPAQITTQARIRVADALDGLPLDGSDAPFSISALVTLHVPNSSGQPGTSGNIVYVWMNNQTNVRGVLFRLTDTPDELTATNVTAVGRATGFTVSMSDNPPYVQVILVSTSGAVIPTGDGPIVQITYDIDAGATLGTTSAMDLSNVTISDANGNLVVPELQSGQFHYVLSGDVDASGVVDAADVDRLVEIVLGTGNAMTDFELLSGDMDHDGDVDLYDLLAVLDLI